MLVPVYDIRNCGPRHRFAANGKLVHNSDKINLQNLPSRGVNANTLKKAVLPPKGYVIIDADSAQIEARVLAWMAGQDDLIEGFAQKKDVYKMMASAIYNKDVSDITKEERFVGKTTILGAGYGLGAKKFQKYLGQQGVTIEFDEAKHIIDTYRYTYPAIPALWDQGDIALGALIDGRTAPYGKEGVININGFLKAVVTPNRIPLEYKELRRTFGGGKQVIAYTSRTGVTGIWGGKFTENCIAAGTPVLTPRGWVPIEDVKMEDKVHDGVEWVSHGGTLFKSVQQCVIVDGVFMTPDHEVLTNDGWVPAGECPEPYRPDLWATNRFTPGGQQRETLDVEVPMPMRWGSGKDWERRSEVCSPGVGTKLRLSNPRVAVRKETHSWDEYSPRVRGMAVNDRSVSSPHASGVGKLWRAWDSGMRTLAGVVCAFLGGYGRLVHAGVGFGSPGQQRTVQPRELPVDNSPGKHHEQTEYCYTDRYSGVESTDRHSCFNSVLPVTPGVAANNPTGQTQSHEVYDIVNAGPRHRFVVQGSNGPFIVHNCIQHLARVIIGTQMLRIAKRYRVVLTVHDAVAIIARKEEAKEAQAYVEACMRWVPPWAEGLPLNCESGIGDSYGEC